MLLEKTSKTFFSAPNKFVLRIILRYAISSCTIQLSWQQRILLRHAKK